MKQFRKIPVIIEALQYRVYEKDKEHKFGLRGSLASAKEIVEFAGDVVMINHYHEEDGWVGELSVKTLEGRMTISVGDWVIKGIKGEFYPWKPDIFKQTYEAVTQ